MARRDTRLPAPYLKRIFARDGVIAQENGYPFDLPAKDWPF